MGGGVTTEEEVGRSPSSSSSLSSLQGVGPPAAGPPGMGGGGGTKDLPLIRDAVRRGGRVLCSGGLRSHDLCRCLLSQRRVRRAWLAPCRANAMFALGAPAAAHPPRPPPRDPGRAPVRTKSQPRTAGQDTRVNRNSKDTAPHTAPQGACRQRARVSTKQHSTVSFSLRATLRGLACVFTSQFSLEDDDVLRQRLFGFGLESKYQYGR